MKTLRKICWFVFSLPIALLPIELFIFLWIFLKPENFWQKITLLSLGTVVLGSAQVFLLIFWIALLAEMFKEIDKEGCPWKF